MLRSMTGFGRASNQNDALAVTVEVRAVNGRFLKVQLKVPPLVRAHELALEAVVRERLLRGSVTAEVQVRRLAIVGGVGIDEAVVRAYQREFRRLGLNEQSLPLMPGVVAGDAGEALDDAARDFIERTLVVAIEDLDVMRQREGRALRQALEAILAHIESLGGDIRERAPVVVRHHQARLDQRLRQLLEGREGTLDTATLSREVAVMADRCDVTEEVDRLRAHVGHARELLASGDGVGRNLDFLAQELHREANTIGAKSADTELGQLVIELKLEVERLREQVANIE